MRTSKRKANDPYQSAPLIPTAQLAPTLEQIRRRAYDLSTFHDQEESASVGARSVRPALAAEQIMLQGELAREIGPDTDFTGVLLRKVRESQGIELTEISARTKIGRTART